MLEVADVFRQCGDRYLQNVGQAMLPSHRRALYDIRACRTAMMGGHVYACDRCAHREYAYHSCKNRHCPKCQGDETRVWLERRQQELLPVRYFHLVFTLPSELRQTVQRHQQILYGVLMKAAAQSLLKLAADPRYVGGKIGILAVLHTWTGPMFFHPHVHCLVPGGGVSEDGRWITARQDYLVPVKALSRIFQGMFLDMLHKALPQYTLPAAVWKKPWVVYCKPTVQGAKKVLRYLGRYVHRVAFTNSRLLRIDGDQVTFRYQNRRLQRWDTTTVSATQFTRRFLQHVLPRGTHRVRYYGIWHPSQRPLLRQVQLLMSTRIPTAHQEDPGTREDVATEGCAVPLRHCPRCHEGNLLLAETIRRQPRPP